MVNLIVETSKYLMIFLMAVYTYANFRFFSFADLRRKHGCRFLISVDGGINHERTVLCRDMGVDVIVGTVHNIFRQPKGLREACLRFEREFG